MGTDCFRDGAGEKFHSGLRDGNALSCSPLAMELNIFSAVAGNQVFRNSWMNPIRIVRL